MMKLASLVLFVIVMLSSCKFETPEKVKPAITKDTLAYTYELIKDRADDCENKPDSSCTVVQIKYPLFPDRDSLNNKVTEKLTGLFGFFQTDITLQEMSDHFLSTYEEFKKRHKKDTRFFTLNSSAKVLRQDSNLTTLAINTYAFQGGAHGGSYAYFINWDTRADKNIILNDILIDGYKDKLTRIADTIFRKQEKLSDTASLANDYFFSGNKFSLPKNFLITPLGLRFLYNIYEIKPYAAGRTDILIPYAQLKSLLKPNTVTTQYIHNAGI
jgi:hypothetical protein